MTEHAELIQRPVDQLCARLEEIHPAQEPIDLRALFAALTGDVISAYCYGKSHDSLAKPDFHPEIYRDFEASGKFSHIMYHFPWIIHVLNALPHGMVALLGSSAKGLVDRRKV